MLAAYAYFHPNSPYNGQQAILDRLLFLLDAKFTQWYNNQLLGDMAFNFQATCAYLMLKTYQPNKIPTLKMTNWEIGIQKILVQCSPKQQYTPIVWLNGDICSAMGAYFGALALGDATSASKARSAIDNCMTKTLLGDGGTHYVGYQNESPSYHGEATMGNFIWYYILTGSVKAKDLIVGTKNYIPLIYVPIGKGYFEWSTSPSWKPYYNQSSIKPAALAKAYLTGDKYNFEIGQGSQWLSLTFLYKSGLTGATLPDNYMVYDKNILGLRGRYGAWGCSWSNPGCEFSCAGTH